MLDSVLQPTDINRLSMLGGGFIAVFCLVSLQVRERLYIGETTVAVLVGILAGSHVLGILDTARWEPKALETVFFEASRFLIAIQVMFAGIELPAKYLKKEIRSLGMLLTVLMLLKWATTAAIIHWVLGLEWLDALVVASCVAPTDPVLANSIVKGKYAERHVPENLRDLLTAESGANDGLGFPFLFIALYLRTSSSSSQAVADWAVNIIVYQIIIGIGLGAVIGFAASWALSFATRRDWIDKPSLLAYGVALAIFTTGFVGYLGSDDLLAAFIAGNTLSWDDWIRKETAEEHIQSTIDQLLTLAYFVLFGAIFPFAELAHLYPWWQILLLCLAVLIFRRLPWVAALYRWIPAIKSWNEALFAGWFGPMGVSGLYYAYLVADTPTAPERLRREIVPLVSVIVLTSVIAHGMSIASFKVGRKVSNTNFVELSRTITSSLQTGAAAAVRRSRSQSRSAAARKHSRTAMPAEFTDVKGVSPIASLSGNEALPPTSTVDLLRDGNDHTVDIHIDNESGHGGLAVAIASGVQPQQYRDASPAGRRGRSRTRAASFEESR
ncbi:Na+/H+ antiporter [Blastocladiella emersonii ATCC 22665]|nr:Na+/H+ antiporter [Blastocladiella emersonii ATCC 22665]